MNIFTDSPLRPTLDVPLYQQLYAHLQAAILAGRLPGGMKLPSTRTTAHDLNLWLVSQYSIEPLAREGLVLGYGDHEEQEMREAVGRLAQVLKLVWPKP
jgi:DNA-binding transcriptional MocR family regulator